MKKHPNNVTTIGQLAKQTSSNIETIRYYERVGIMPVPERSTSGYRQYHPADIKRLNFIKRCRNLGFSIDNIKNLLAISDDAKNHTRAEVKNLTQQHLQSIHQKIRDLKNLEEALSSISANCDGAHTSADTCPILNALLSEQHKTNI